MLNILINIFWEPYIVFHDGLKTPMKRYFVKYAGYELFTIFIIIVVGSLSLVTVNVGLPLLIIYTGAIEIIVILLFFTITVKTSEFRYLCGLLNSIWARVTSKL